MHPILFSIGIFTIYSFGTMIAVGYLVAGMLLWHDMHQKGKTPVLYLDLGIGLMLFALLGGRLLYMLLHLKMYLEDPLEIFKIHHGGLVFYGGFLGALLFALFFIRRKRLPGWETLDDMTPYAVLVHAFGRIGCFLNGCCYGKPTGLWWGVIFPGGEVSLHPAQLYESLFLFLLFILLRRFSQRRIFKKGTLFVFYLLTYGVMRFFMEFLRGDQERAFWGLTLAQLLSMVLIASSIFLWKQKRA